MSTEPEILKALLGADGVEEFLSDYWPDSVYVAHGDHSRLPDALLDEVLNEFDALSLRYKGVVSFFGDANSGHMVPVEGIDAGSPYRCGLSVYLTDVRPYFPDIDRLVGQLEVELGINEGSARAGVFASPTNCGISCHYDSVDVFSIQLRGTKKFDVAPVSELRYPWGFQYVTGQKPIDDLYPQSTEGFPNWEKADFRTVEMQPGSVLFMPRGTWHRTEAGGDSIAVSIGLTLPSAAECMLEQLRLLMLQDPAWRKPLYGAWGDGPMRESARAQAAELIAKLPDLASTLEPEFAARPLMSESSRISYMNSRSWVQRTPNTSLIIGPPPADTTEEDSMLVSVETHDRGTKRITYEVEMPSWCEPMLRWIGDRQDSFQVSELVERFAELGEDHHIQLVQSLTTGGLLRVYWFPKLKAMHADP